MSGLINKAKDMLHKDKGDNPSSHNAGPHSSAMGNQADPRIDSDRDHRNNPSSTYGSSTTSGGLATGTTTSGSTNAGPHSSNMMNKMDPRVDSDRDNRNDPLSRTGGYGTQEGYGAQGSNPMPSSGGHTGTYGSSGAHTGTTGHSGIGTTGTTGYNTSSSTNAGPHNSNMMNKMDPRVDSDRDNRNDPLSRTGGYGTQEGYGAQGSNPMPSSGGYSGTTGHSGMGTTGHSGVGTTGTSGYGTSSSTTAGPHNSNMMNKMDPRVDSDRDNRNDPTSRVGGYGTQDNYGTGAGSGLGTSTHRPGDSAMGQTAGYGNTGTTGGLHGQPAGVHSSAHNTATPGSGNTDQTAGPHNSNLLNKLDPRVDSDMDGSKTYGGNQTFR